MKAIRFYEYGGPEVLKYEDAPKPVPGSGEVLARVHAAAVNPVDWKIRQGHMKDRIGHKLPLIPGWDFSGIIESVGPDVDAWKAGDKIFTRPDLSRDGAYAEYIVVRATEIAVKPRSVDFIHASAVSLAGLTAYQALFEYGGLKAGQTVLIHAAAGGVGSYAVQLAKWKGATVIGTASGLNQDYIAELGVDTPINYETTRFEDVAHDVDVVLDAIGGDVQRRSFQVLKKGGMLVSIVAAPNPEEAKAHGVRATIFMAQTKPEDLQELARLVDAGKLKIYVEKIFPLSEARQAHELSQSGHVRGKIVLQIEY